MTTRPDWADSLRRDADFVDQAAAAAIRSFRAGQAETMTPVVEVAADLARQIAQDIERASRQLAMAGELHEAFWDHFLSLDPIDDERAFDRFEADFLDAAALWMIQHSVRIASRQLAWPEA